MCTAASGEPSRPNDLSAAGSAAGGSTSGPGWSSSSPHDSSQREGPGRAAMARRLIEGYQDNLSGLKMGPTCRFDPTCSSYALEAYSRHGFVKGTLLTIGRLARCGPWHPGGWDPVPPRWPRRRSRGESRTV